MRLLVAENDHALGTFLCRGLDAEHYVVDLAADGEEAAHRVDEHDYDLLILDLNLPRRDGMDVLKHARAHKPHPLILILTGRARLEDRVAALDQGADDCLLKPFAYSELSARVRALLRRGNHAENSILRVGDLEIDRFERTTKRAGRTIDLTPKEFALLEYLVRNAGKCVTRPMIIEHVWNLSFDTMTNVVDVYINYSASQVDKRKVGQLAIAIQVAFQQMGIFEASNTKPPLAVSEPMPFAKVQMVENVERIAPLGRIANPPRGALAGAPNRDELNKVQKDLEVAMSSEIKKHIVALTPTREGLVVSLREVGFFDSGSADVRPDGLAAVDAFISILAPRRLHIRIEGHTDNVPIHNQHFNSNWELSTTRATGMIKLFINHYKLAPERLSASGYAEYYPVASNSTLEGRAQNRRVDLVILNSPTPPLPSAP
jgi:DNA-binding response OmpR family regulator/flagellar motor protein MotB